MSEPIRAHASTELLTPEAHHQDLYTPEEFNELFPEFISKETTERSRLLGGRKISKDQVTDLTVIENSFTWKPARLAQMRERVIDSVEPFENEPVAEQEVEEYRDHGLDLLQKVARSRVQIVNQKIGRIGTLFYGVHTPQSERTSSFRDTPSLDELRIGRMTRMITFRGADFDPICGLIGKSGVEYEFRPQVSDYWLVKPA